jgi:hypothetical protein
VYVSVLPSISCNVIFFMLGCCGAIAGVAVAAGCVKRWSAIEASSRCLHDLFLYHLLFLQFLHMGIGQSGVGGAAGDESCGGGEGWKMRATAWHREAL